MMYVMAYLFIGCLMAGCVHTVLAEDSDPLSVFIMSLLWPLTALIAIAAFITGVIYAHSIR